MLKASLSCRQSLDLACWGTLPSQSEFALFVPNGVQGALSRLGLQRGCSAQGLVLRSPGPGAVPWARCSAHLTPAPTSWSLCCDAIPPPW